MVLGRIVSVSRSNVLFSEAVSEGLSTRKPRSGRPPRSLIFPSLVRDRCANPRVVRQVLCTGGVADSFPICSSHAWPAIAGSPCVPGQCTVVAGWDVHAACGHIHAQLFTQHRHFGFQLVDSGVWRITVLDQRFAACEHRDPHDADHIQYCAADERMPVPGKAQDSASSWISSGMEIPRNPLPYQSGPGSVLRDGRYGGGEAASSEPRT